MDHRDYKDCLESGDTLIFTSCLLDMFGLVLVSQLLSVTLCFRDPWDRKGLKETR